jgi:hypothetical protein
MGTAALKVFVHHGVDVLERVAPLVTALHGSAGDADAVAVAQLGEQRRVDSYRAAVGILAGKEGGLRRGLAVSEAADVMLVLFSAEVYQALGGGRGWSRTRASGSSSTCWSASSSEGKQHVAQEPARSRRHRR